jgi:glycosyltransferase involved in cell wall biosynthesis
VWAVIDGSTDGSGKDAERLGIDGARVIHLSKNVGKGGAVLAAFLEASARGFDHALVMDADGQHPVEFIRTFFDLSEKNPGCLIAGVPIFGPDAPRERVAGRRVGNTLAKIETIGRGAKDSLFGFRVYPIEPTIRILEATSTGRRFDFDTVLAVRLAWSGVPTLNHSVPVKYPAASVGGVTHFQYVRDNVLLAKRHAGLFFEMPTHIPRLLSLRCP